MCFEKVTPDVVNKLYRQTKLQKVIEEFISSDELAVRIPIKPGEYASVRSAQSSYCSSIRRFNFPVSARTLNGNLYLIRSDPDWKQSKHSDQKSTSICSTCTHREVCKESGITLMGNTCNLYNRIPQDVPHKEEEGEQF